jgi:hypothetical protein
MMTCERWRATEIVGFYLKWGKAAAAARCHHSEMMSDNLQVMSEGSAIG